MNAIELFKITLENYMAGTVARYKKELNALYGLDEVGCAIIGFMLQNKDRFLSEKILGDIGRFESDLTTERELFALKKKGFIRMVRVVNEVGFYQLTREAVDAFQKNEVFGVDCYPDHIAVLKERPFENAYDLKRFYYSLSRCDGDTCLRDGVEELQIKALPEDRQLLFWTVVRHFIQHFGEPFKEKAAPAGPVFSFDDEKKESPKPTEGLERLADIGLLEYDAQSDGYFLPPLVLTKLLYGHDELVKYNAIAPLATIIKARDIEPCELFYAQKTQVEIDHLRTLLSPDGYRRARNILLRKKRKPAIISLLWGPPGTGKTEIVKQLARESGRDIILFDAAKLTESAWGATEHLYRALFHHYAYISAVSSLPPILLMNEADDVLSKRLQGLYYSMDKAQNSISNILLEEFENLNGILLATTNLADNLDRAFERRFLFKTEIGNPDQKARKMIWQSKVSDLTEEEAAILSEQYQMTGAQVSNVAAKCELAELYYDGDRGLAFLQNLCEEELSASQSSNRPKIGF